MSKQPDKTEFILGVIFFPIVKSVELVIKFSKAFGEYILADYRRVIWVFLILFVAYVLIKLFA